jgi:hypothetical protein
VRGGVAPNAREFQKKTKKTMSSQRRHLWLAADRVLPVVLHVRRAVASLLTDHVLQVREQQCTCVGLCVVGRLTRAVCRPSAQRVLTVVHDLLLGKLGLPLRLLLAQPAETVVGTWLCSSLFFSRRAASFANHARCVW